LACSLALGAGVGVAWLVRVSAILEKGATPGAADLKGVLADISVAALLGALLCLALRAQRRWRWLLPVFVVFVIWVTLNLGNFEHVVVLGNNSSLAYADFLTDATFFRGSALRSASPLRWTLGFALTAVFVGLALRHRPWPKASTKWVSLTGVVALCAHLAWPLAGAAPMWRQTSFLIENLRWLNASEELEEARVPVPGYFPSELHGEAWTELGRSDHNVLLLVLEGVSGAYLPDLADYQGVDMSGQPRLDKLNQRARQHITFANFFNHQRQTNRGLYSLLCGDLPKLITAAPKMSELGWGRDPISCLPALLAEAGYATAFVQAAPLAFMGKDRFMPRAGFEIVHGAEWFSGDQKGDWGVDDRALFAKVLPELERLDRGGQPWFVTVLTAGTHHPFTVPRDFESAYPEKTFGHAAAYLDDSVAWLLDELEKGELLDDTLVIITSDESFGRDGDLETDPMLMAQVWGTLTVMLPKARAGQIVEAFSQTDVAVSILDYLGLRDRTRQLGGRSLFRAYAEPRAIPFANTYLRLTAGIDEARTLHICAETFASCRSYELDPERLFAPDPAQVQASRGGVAFLKTLAARSLAVAAESATTNEWVLIEAPSTVELSVLERHGTPRIDLFGNQYISVSRGTRIDVELEFEVVGEGGRVELRQALDAVARTDMPSGADFRRQLEHEAERLELGPSNLGMRPRFYPKRRTFEEIEGVATPGRVHRVRYSYVADRDLERLQASLRAYIKSGTPSLVFTVAKLTVTADSGGEPGLTVHAEADLAPLPKKKKKKKRKRQKRGGKKKP
jgi:hypothetical protein